MFEVDWEDSTTSIIHHRMLRGYCPCAECQGHHGPVQFREPSSDKAMQIDKLAAVGEYAIRIAWGDGHQHGIYSFVFLKELGALYGMDKKEAETHSFGRGGSTFPRET